MPWFSTGHRVDMRRQKAVYQVTFRGCSTTSPFGPRARAHGPGSTMHFVNCNFAYSEPTKEAEFDQFRGSSRTGSIPQDHPAAR
eukprot:344573-Rhodomonas_salina.2